jgi:hypothetical protein
MGSGNRRRLGALLLFGIAFGYLEAAVVNYLRLLHEPARQLFHPGRPPGDLFPLLTLDQLRSAGPVLSAILPVEIGREAATIVMLGGIALAVAANPGEWLAAFAIAFGMWDIAFYVFLRLLLAWPQSLLTWDILFLIPLPWVGPVIAPMAVSGAMIACGVWHFRREAAGQPVRVRPGDILGMAAGAGVIILSFTLDCRTIMAGDMPPPFHWGVFAAGLGIGVLSYARAAARDRNSAAAAA